MFLFTFPYQELFKIGKLPVNTYGLCIGLGVLAAMLFLSFASKKLQLPADFEDYVETTGLCAIVFALFTSIVFQNFWNYLESPGAFRWDWKNMTFQGGLIGGVGLFLILYFAYGRKKHGAHLLELLPIAACCILVAHGFGRLGCFFGGGCCYGKNFGQTRMPFTVYYRPGNGPDAVWLYPTQLFEAAFLFLGFIVLAVLTVKRKFRHSMEVYMIGYGIFRFLIEFIRDDDRGKFILGLSPAQWQSIIMIIGGIVLLIILRKKYNDKAKILPASNEENAK